MENELFEGTGYVSYSPALGWINAGNQNTNSFDELVIPMIKGSTQQEDVTVINIYAHDTGAPKYGKQILADLNEEIHSDTIIGGDLKPQFHHWIDHPERKSVKKHWP